MALIFLLVPAIQAQVFISVGDWEFAPGTADPTISIRVSNTGASIPLLGINLNLQISDGGIEAGGADSGPRIVDVDLFAPGALFATRNNGRGGGGAIVPQLFEVGTLIPAGTTLSLLPGDHLLATVTLDLGALEAGRTWQMFLDTLNGTTALLDPQGQSIPASLEAGSVSLVLVPESMWVTPVIAIGLMGYGISSLAMRHATVIHRHPYAGQAVLPRRDARMGKGTGKGTGLHPRRSYATTGART